MAQNSNFDNAAFISYRRIPSQILAYMLSRELDNRDVRTFMDRRSPEMNTAGPFIETLHKAIEGSRALVCVLAENTLESDYVRQELEHAYRHAKTMIPVFEESFKSPPNPLEEPIRTLLNNQGVKIFTEQGLFIDQSIDILADMIGRTDPVAAPPPTNKAGKQRIILISKMRQEWIKGVLETPIDLSMLSQVRTPYQMGEPDGEQQTFNSLVQIVDVFNGMYNELLVLGEPGAGKTKALLELASRLMEAAERDASLPVPFVLPLSRWAIQRKPIKDWVTDVLLNEYRISAEVIEQWFKEGQLVLLLDALDEVDIHYRKQCIEYLNDFCSQHTDTGLVVSSRVTDYGEIKAQLNLRGTITLQPLAEAQIDGYLAKQGTELSNLRQTLKQNAALSELATSPLILSLMAKVYRDASNEELAELSAQGAWLERLLDRFIQRMFADRKTKRQAGAKPDDPDPYSNDETVHWLTWLAKRLTERNQYVFLIEQMQPDWLQPKFKYWQYIGLFSLFYGLSITIPFTLTIGMAFGPVIGPAAWWLIGPSAGILLSLAVWMASKHIKGIIAPLSVGIAAFVTAASAYGLALGMNIGLAVGVVVGLFAFFAFAAVSFLGLGEPEDREVRNDSIIYSIETLGWSSKNGWIGLALGLIIVGGIISIIIAFASNALTGLAIGLALGSGLGATGGLRAAEADIEQKTRPNQGFWRSLENFSFVGLKIGIIGMVAGTLGFGSFLGIGQGLVLGLLCGLTVGVIAGLQFGGIAVLQQLALRFVLIAHNDIPRKHPDFLQYACDLNFIRKVGGRYIFIHRTLQEQFARKANI